MEEEGTESRKATIIARACGALVVVAALVFVIDLLEGPFFSLSTRTWAPEQRGDRLIGGIEGAVKGSDLSSLTVRIASGFLGLSSLPVVITPQTQISINGKLGGFADLDRGQLVRVAYEVQPDRLVAWRVDVLERVVTADRPTPDRGTQEAVAPAAPDTHTVVETPSQGPRTAPPATSGTASEPPARGEASSSAAAPAGSSAPGASASARSSSESPAPVSTPTPRSDVAASPSAPRTAVVPSTSPRTQVPEPPRAASVPAPSTSPRTQVPEPPRAASVPAPGTSPRTQAQEPPRAASMPAPGTSPRTQVQEPRSAPAPAAAPRTPAGLGNRKSEDGGDAIDWLLKEQRGQ